MKQWDFDDLLPHVGEFGRFQKILVWLVCLPACIPCGFHAFNQLFMAPVPDRNISFLNSHPPPFHLSLLNSCLPVHVPVTCATCWGCFYQIGPSGISLGVLKDFQVVLKNLLKLSQSNPVRRVMFKYYSNNPAAYR